MRKQFLKSMLLALLCVVGGVTSAWAAGFTRTLTEKLEVKGYIARQLYNFQNNTPEVLPTTGDLRYRDGNIWGLHNFESGTRSATATIPVKDGDILIIQNYTGYTATINRGTENTALSTSTGYQCFDITTTADDVTFTVPRYGGIVAALVMEPKPTKYTYDFEDEKNPFSDRSRITSAIEDDATLNSKVLGFTCAKNAQNGYSFSDFALTNLFDFETVVKTNYVFDFDYYNTQGGRAILTIGDKSVRGTDGGSTNTTYNSTGAIFALGSDKTYALINGKNYTLATYTNKWLHVTVTVSPSDKKVSYVIKEGENVLRTESNIDYLSSDANVCSQIDLFGYINNSHCAMIDNLVIQSKKVFSYTVNGVDAEENVLATFASGNFVEGSDAITVPYSQYLLSGNTFYNIAAASSGDYYRTTFTPNADNYQVNLTYKNSNIENVVFFTEGEDIAGVSKGSNTARASKGQMGYTANSDTYKDVTTIQPGKYIIYSRGVNGNSSARTCNFKAGEDVVYTFSIVNGTDVKGNSEEFIVTEESTLSLASTGSSASGLDWFYIVKTGEASDDAILAAAKDALQSLITEAEALEGTEGKTAFDAAVAAAQTTYDESTDIDEVKAAIAALTLAIKKFKAANVTDVADGTYYIKNVSTGKWLGPGNSWGTQASMLNHADYWKLKLNDGKYTLESVVSNGGQNYYLSGTYCDGGATNFTLTKVEGAHLTYTIANGENLLTAKGNIVDMSGTDATAAVSQWQFFSEDDMALMLADATIQAPADATYLIKDHDLGRNNRDYAAWSNTKASAPKTSDDPVLNSSRYSVEAYHATFDVNQTLTDIPNGVYAVQVNGFYRQDGSDANLPYVYANDSKTTLPARTGSENSMQAAAVSFEDGNYLSEPAYVQVTNGRLKLGVSTTGTSCWVIFKNFHLTYYGDVDPRDVLPAITLAEGKMNAEVAAAQTAAKAAYDETFSMDNYNALKNAAAAAQASKNAYATVEAVLDAATTNLQSTNVYTSAAYTTFKEAITTAQTNYNNNTMTTAEATGLQAKLNRAVWGTTPAPMACDYIISAWTSTNNVAVANFWSSEGDAEGSSGMTVPFIQYWVGDNDKMADNTVTGTVNGLDNGLYSVTAFMRVVNKKEGDDAGYDGITLKVNDGNAVAFADATTYSDGYAKEITAEGLVKDGNLTITIDVKGTNASWLSFKNVKYVKVRNLTPEEAAVAPTAIALSQENVTLDLTDNNTATLTPSFTPADATTNAVWSSSNEQVATVDAEGNVKAMAPGTATITITSTINQNVSASATITVENAPALASVSEAGEGDFYLRNVATGWYLAGGNDYGTRATLTKHGIPMGLTQVSEGVYNIDTYMFRDATNHYLRGDYCDQNATNIYITKLANGNYSLSTAENGEYLTLLPGTKIVDKTAANTESTMAQWQLVSRDDILKNMASASENTPADATFLLSEANISKYLRKSYDRSSWKGNFSYGGADANQCAERFHDAATNVYQTVAVPNGKYKVRAQGFYRADEGSQNASYLYANDVKKPLQLLGSNEQDGATGMSSASAAFTKGQYWNELEVTVTDNKLTVGITTTDGNNWTIWDNFELYLLSNKGLNQQPVIADGQYYLTANEGESYVFRGADSGTQATLSADNELYFNVSTDDAGITTLTADDTNLRLFWNEEMVYTNGTQHVKTNYHHPYWAVEAATNNGFKLRNIESGLYLAMGDGVATLNENGDVWTFDKRSNDYSALNSAIASAEKNTLGFDKDEYAPYNNIAAAQTLAVAKAFDQQKYYPSLKIQKVASTLANAQWVKNDEEVNAIFWKTDYTAADKTGDYVHPIGWTNTGYNTRVMNSELAPNDAAMQTIGTAVFSKFNTTYGEKEGYTMPLKASTVYNISFRYCGWGNNPTTNVVLTVDDEAVAVTPTSFRPATNDGNKNAEHWYEYNGYFTTTKAGNYVLALNKVDQGQQQIAWTDLTLKRAVAEDITIAETADYTPAARYGNVTFKRTLVEGWNGLTVPFDMTINEAKSVFNATEVKTFTGIKLNDDETVTLCFGNANGVKAGVPFLIKVSKAGSSYGMGTMLLSDNAAVKPVTCTVEGNENIKYTMQSSYKAETDLTNVVFALIQGNKFFYHNTGKASSAKAFRAWFVNESTDAAQGARLRFDLGDDETTGIKSIANDADSLTATYDLQGRAVKTAAKKGLYIKNGKKMVVK